MRNHATWLTATLLSGALVAGCQPMPAAPTKRLDAAGPKRAVLQAESSLPEYAAFESNDWALQRLGVAGAIKADKAKKARGKRRVLAFPTQGALWEGGLNLSQFGCQSTDIVPNGPASTFHLQGALASKVFLITQEGKFIKVNAHNPAEFTTLDLGKAFSHTAVTMSPLCGRAYLLADDGSLFVVDTVKMTVIASRAVGGGYGIAPHVDPIASRADDGLDYLYVAANDGRVHRMTISRDKFGRFFVSPPIVYDVATTATPLGTPHKIAAPAVVMGGVIHVGDQAGMLHAYDTANPAASFSFGLGAPVNTAPAIETQNGTYAMTDPAGNPKYVPVGRPVYAFVTAGASAAWINLHDGTVARSLPLRIDDNQPAKRFGYLLDYDFSDRATTEVLAAVDGGNLNTESPDRNLPGYAAPRSNDYLGPAETNTYEVNGEARGGPIETYLRFKSATLLSGAIVNSAKLTLTTAFDQASRVPEIRTASPYYRGTSTLWSSDALTGANRPNVGGDNVGLFLGGGVDKRYGNFTFKRDRSYDWDVTSAFGSAQSDYALALKHNAGGDAVLWPEGPVGAAAGKKAKKEYQVEAVRFLNNPLNADPAPAASKDTRPLLTLQLAGTRLPNPSIETPPVIDSANKRLYVFYTNALYQLSFASTGAFTDTVPGQKNTLFNMTKLGTSGSGGATYAGQTLFVGNGTAPVVNADASAVYALDRYPVNPGSATPASWNYSLNKLTLPLNPAADALAPVSPTFTDMAKAPSNLLIIDRFTTGAAGEGDVYFGLGNGKVYCYER